MTKLLRPNSSNLEGIVQCQSVAYQVGSLSNHGQLFIMVDASGDRALLV